MKPIIITGTKRSGSTFVAAWITSSGYWCSHERYFKCGRKFRLKHDSIEASWAAAPYLPELDVHVIHQVRHPLKVASSLLARGDFKPERDKSKDWSVRVCPKSAAPEDDQLALSLRFWVEWNRMAYRYADVIWRFEELNPKGLAETLSRFGRPLEESRAELGYSVLPEAINTAPRKPQPLTWDDIPESRLKETAMDDAQRYGYGYGPE